MENTSSYEEISQRNRDLEILTDLIQAVHKSYGLEDIYRVALDSVMKLENVDMAVVYLVDKQKNEAVIQAHRNLPEGFVQRAGRIPYPRGVTWEVINTGKILNAKSAEQDPNIGQAGRELGFRSMLGIPINLDGKTIGVFWLLSYREHLFTRSEEELLTSIGTQIAVAIARAKMFEEMKRAEERLRESFARLSKKNRYETIISTMTRSIHQSLHLQDVLENTVDAMSKNMGIDNVFVSLVEGQEAVLKAHRGYPEWFIERVRRIPYPRGVTWRVITEGKPMYCPDADNDTFLGPAGREVGTKSYVSMPIHFGGKAVGVININSLQKNAFDEEELKLLEIVAQQIEAALHNAQIAETLRQSEERYRTLFDQSPVGVFIFNEDLKITQCNERMVQILQSSYDRIIGLDMRGLKDQSFMPAMGRVFEGQSCHQESFYEATTSSAKLWLSLSLTPLRDIYGKVIGGMAVVEDITRRKLAEEVLRESEERYRTLVEYTSDLIIEVSSDGRFLYLSPNHRDVSGYEPIELVGRSIFEHIHPDDRSTVMAEFQRAIKAFSSGHSIYRYKHKSGEWRLLESTGKPYRTATGEIRAVIASRDITEHRRIEEELLKAQKLESIGVLAGGIAHDFNNLLTAILGNISLSKMSTDPKDNKIYKRLSEAEKACFRAKDLTQRLLTFSKGGAPVKEVTSIGEFIKDSASFAVSGSDVRCEFHISEDLWKVEVDEGQISQVINNVMINAEQAMPGGGVIRVRAENINRDELSSPLYYRVDGLPLKGGRYVRITIEDEGIGIPQEHLPKIFDPYFTTKHSGSGLGLAAVYSIIKSHDGYIGVESELGAGTKFHIYLPASDKEILVKEDTKRGYVRSKGRVLVMDDEEMVRELTGEVLGYLGYEVEFASDGVETIKLYVKGKENNKPFGVVLLDLTIPGGMGGKETIKGLLEIDPQVKAIVSSGYSSDPVISEYRDYGFRGVVSKPYSIEQLAEALHKVINEK